MLFVQFFWTPMLSNETIHLGCIWNLSCPVKFSCIVICLVYFGHDHKKQVSSLLQITSWNSSLQTQKHYGIENPNHTTVMQVISNTVMQVTSNTVLYSSVFTAVNKSLKTWHNFFFSQFSSNQTHSLKHKNAYKHIYEKKLQQNFCSDNTFCQDWNRKLI